MLDFETSGHRDGFTVPLKHAESSEPRNIGASMSEKEHIKVFVSYSRKDRRWLEQLQSRLKPLEREGLIEPWHDLMITAGSDWDREISQNLSSADIIIMLVSSHFLASDYCHKREVSVALYRHERGEARVVPILVAPVDLPNTPFASLQVLPSDARPVKSWTDSDKAWLDVQKGLRRVIEDLAEQKRLSENHATSARRTALRIAMLRGKRTQLGLLIALEASRHDPTAELWSELASSIVSCPTRPLPPGMPDGIEQWVLSPDGRHALFWYRGRRGEVVELQSGKSVAVLEDVELPMPYMEAGDPGDFSSDGSLIVAGGGQPAFEFTGSHGDYRTSGRIQLGVLKVWDSATGKLRASAKGVLGRATFSSSGREILVDHAGDAVLVGMDELSLVSLSAKPQAQLSVLDRRGRRSPDGELILAVHTEDRNAYIHGNGETYTLQGHEHRIIHGDWSPDGSRILTCARDSTGRIWDRKGQIQATFWAHRAALTWGAWHPKGQCVVTVAEDGSSWIWDIDGQPRCSLTPGEPGVRFCKWSPSGRQLLIWGHGGGPLLVFDENGRQVTALHDDLEDITQPDWHPDGDAIYGLGAGGRLGKWSTWQEPLHLLAPRGCVVAADFTLDGRAVLTVDVSAERATLWDLNGDQIAFASVPRTCQTATAGLSPDGKRFLTVSRSEGVRLWDLSGKQVGALQGHDDHQAQVWCAAWSTSGDRILTTANDGAARLWSADGLPLAVLGDHGCGVIYGAFSPDGLCAFTVCMAGTLRLWSLEAPFISLPTLTEAAVKDEAQSGTAGGKARQETGFPFGPYGVAGQLKFTPAPDSSSEGRAARLLRLWSRVAGGSYVGRWPRFSPDGSQVLLPSGRILAVSSHPDKAAQSTEDGEKASGSFRRSNPFALELVGPKGESAHDACYSPDGALIATAHLEVARVWDHTGRRIHELKGHIASVWMVRFSPDGQRLLTVVDEGRALQLWNVVDGRWLTTLPGPPDPILHVAFSHDGRQILAHAARTVPGLGVITSGYVWIWPADLSGLIELAESRAGRRLQGDERQFYLGS